jgi:tRNA (guanine26-N2/guanine27-N2)-dimethyltransferase
MMRVLSCQGSATSMQRWERERGVTFNPGVAFFRAQSLVARDFAVLSAILHKAHGSGAPLHVLETMAASGVRSARYLQHAQADFVWSNECSTAAGSQEALLHTLAAALEAVHAQPLTLASCELSYLGSKAHDWSLSDKAIWGEGRGGDEQSAALPTPDVLCRATAAEAGQLLMWCGAHGKNGKTGFDLIDIDSFGAETVKYIGLAMETVREGGLLCLTSTAGTLAGGRDPANSLALYGCHLAPIPSANEQASHLHCMHSTLHRCNQSSHHSPRA